MRERLSGQRIALFESRLAEEICELVRRGGGVPVCVPAVRERRRAAGPEVDRLLRELAAEAHPLFAFSTGVGTAALFEEARALRRSADLRNALSRALIVCRGPKPVAALHKEGITAALRARAPYTTAEFVEALGSVEVRDRMAVLVHYGERNPEVASALEPRGARLRELMLYEWELPEDTSALAGIVEDLARGGFAAAAFTTQIQARHLLQIAGELGRRGELVQALRDRVVVAAVGPTCARVLSGLGIPPQVVPQTPKMAAMLNALVARLAGEEVLPR
ncbi:MAG TPA: uroporphyrinogen-III synthase [Myxococcales bacterium]|nr:uroporphyrinogen-III synthase [Myxococcales bacterium]